MDEFADLRTEGRYVPAAEGVGANEIALNDLRRGMRVSDCGQARVQENHAVAVPRPRLGAGANVKVSPWAWSKPWGVSQRDLQAGLP